MSHPKSQAPVGRKRSNMTVQSAYGNTSLANSITGHSRIHLVSPSRPRHTMSILVTRNPEHGEESEQLQKWLEYEKHLVPISRSDFPAKYIQELQQKFSKTPRYRWEPLGWNSYAPDANLHVDPCNPSDDWLRALRVPVLHYGILLSREETEKYGTQCYHRQYTDEGEEAPKGAPPECSMPIVNYLNSRLAEEVPGSPKELRFLSRQHVSQEDDNMICSLISTDKPHTWKSDQQIDVALKVLRQVLQLPEDRKPMWYFDREFFGPQTTEYAEFDADRMVGSELLKRFPEHVQAAIRAGTGWESYKPSD